MFDYFFELITKIRFSNNSFEFIKLVFKTKVCWFEPSLEKQKSFFTDPYCVGVSNKHCLLISFIILKLEMFSLRLGKIYFLPLGTYSNIGRQNGPKNPSGYGLPMFSVCYLGIAIGLIYGYFLPCALIT